MEDLFKKIEKNVKENNLISNGDRIIVGVSGGPDSIFLLHALDKLKKQGKLDFEMEIAHVNHLIRKEASDDQKFVEKLAKQFGYKCHTLECDVSKQSKKLKISTEECGRNVRYDFFNKLLLECKANKISVAHNQTDNVETVIMNFIRGAGISGLKGMDYYGQNIIRPMLNIKKEDIINYLNSKGIKYLIDRTNIENIYTRNRIRNDLIKKIEKEYNPNFLDTTQRMIELNKQDYKLIEECVNNEYEKLKMVFEDGKITINRKELAILSSGMKYRIIRKILTELLGNIQGIEKIHVSDISKLIDNNIKGKQYIIGNKFTVKIKTKNIIEFSKNK